MPHKGHSGRPLSRKVIAAMRADYVVEQNLEKIAAKYGVCAQTVAKYRDDDQWGEYAKMVHERTREKAAEINSDQNANDIKLLRDYLVKQAQALAGSEKLDFSILGIDKAIRLMQLLAGLPDSRTENAGGVDDVTRAIERLTTGEIKARIKELEGRERESRD